MADSAAAVLTLAVPVITAFSGWAAGKLTRACRMDKSITLGVKSLLRGQIIGLGLHYLRTGGIPPYGLDNLENYYAAYVDLGDGDKSTHDIMERCRQLPLRGGF